jgi:hypothetical protein
MSEEPVVEDFPVIPLMFDDVTELKQIIMASVKS